MKTKLVPMLFSTPMVQAILDGRKTQTRRIMKPQPHADANQVVRDGEGYWFDYQSGGGERCLGGKWLPRIQPGDVLWVRETWCGLPHINERNARETWYYYAADGECNEADFNGWKPSIHMPYAACRIWLRVKDVRVDRVQEISEADAIAEGCENRASFSYFDPSTRRELRPHQHEYMRLWNSINGDDSWASNPYVWVYTFERCEKPGGAA